MVGGDEKDGLGDPIANRLVLIKMAAPTQGRKQCVIKRGTSVEVGDLQEDMVQHGRQRL